MYPPPTSYAMTDPLARASLASTPSAWGRTASPAPHRAAAARAIMDRASSAYSTTRRTATTSSLPAVRRGELLPIDPDADLAYSSLPDEDVRDAEYVSSTSAASAGRAPPSVAGSRRSTRHNQQLVQVDPATALSDLVRADVGDLPAYLANDIVPVLDSVRAALTAALLATVAGDDDPDANDTDDFAHLVLDWSNPALRASRTWTDPPTPPVPARDMAALVAPAPWSRLRSAAAHAPAGWSPAEYALTTAQYRALAWTDIEQAYHAALAELMRRVAVDLHVLDLVRHQTLRRAHAAAKEVARAVAAGQRAKEHEAWIRTQETQGENAQRALVEQLVKEQFEKQQAWMMAMQQQQQAQQQQQLAAPPTATSTVTAAAPTTTTPPTVANGVVPTPGGDVGAADAAPATPSPAAAADPVVATGAPQTNDDQVEREATVEDASDAEHEHDEEPHDAEETHDETTSNHEEEEQDNDEDTQTSVTNTDAPPAAPAMSFADWATALPVPAPTRSVPSETKSVAASEHADAAPVVAPAAEGTADVPHDDAPAPIAAAPVPTPVPTPAPADPALTSTTGAMVVGTTAAPGRGTVIPTQPSQPPAANATPPTATPTPAAPAPALAQESSAVAAAAAAASRARTLHGKLVAHDRALAAAAVCLYTLYAAIAQAAARAHQKPPTALRATLDVERYRHRLEDVLWHVYTTQARPIAAAAAEGGYSGYGAVPAGFGPGSAAAGMGNVYGAGGGGNGNVYGSPGGGNPYARVPAPITAASAGGYDGWDARRPGGTPAALMGVPDEYLVGALDVPARPQTARPDFFSPAGAAAPPTSPPMQQAQLRVPSMQVNGEFVSRIPVYARPQSAGARMLRSDPRTPPMTARSASSRTHSSRSHDDEDEEDDRRSRISDDYGWPGATAPVPTAAPIRGRAPAAVRGGGMGARAPSARPISRADVPLQRGPDKPMGSLGTVSNRPRTVRGGGVVGSAPTRTAVPARPTTTDPRGVSRGRAPAPVTARSPPLATPAMRRPVSMAQMRPAMGVSPARAPVTAAARRVASQERLMADPVADPAAGAGWDGPPPFIPAGTLGLGDRAIAQQKFYNRLSSYYQRGGGAAGGHAVAGTPRTRGGVEQDGMGYGSEYIGDEYGVGQEDEDDDEDGATTY
ncbi:hypothetical protein GGF31_006283 [Allomyces arbusculus]|nr:hypothetical protein GGF31_006283 [Allomyces arbusculus]